LVKVRVPVELNGFFNTDAQLLTDLVDNGFQCLRTCTGLRFTIHGAKPLGSLS
jgi:hypothetical protein